MSNYIWPLLNEEEKYTEWSIYYETGGRSSYVKFCNMLDGIYDFLAESV